MRNEVAKRVQMVAYVDDRLIAVRIGMLPKDLVIIQVYMPTSDSEEEDVNRMYEKIDNVLEEEKSCFRISNGLQGAHINSDHVLIRIEIELTLKRVEKAKVVKKWNLEKMEEMGREVIREKLSKAITEDRKEEECSE
ncbi:hypothetical protein J437_LFUL012493 [Ladona fulva]|uniref:Uncharacterized protein n=1 Tax=Ladona fulva TaxID=123851 RepID=A0A8K0KG04_LADFU|nr:hypothetical protein J437_LFUL012493 [Ladona fulva]